MKQNKRKRELVGLCYSLLSRCWVLYSLQSTLTQERAREVFVSIQCSVTAAAVVVVVVERARGELGGVLLRLCLSIDCWMIFFFLFFVFVSAFFLCCCWMIVYIEKATSYAKIDGKF